MTESATVNAAEEGASQPLWGPSSPAGSHWSPAAPAASAPPSRSLATQGAAVAAGYSGNVERASSSRSSRARSTPRSSAIHQGNVASGDDCRRVVAEVIEQHGRLDILVNNAGITIDKTMLKLTDDDWHKVLAVNLSGAFFLSQAALAAHGGARQRPDHQRLARSSARSATSVRPTTPRPSPACSG